MQNLWAGWPKSANASSALCILRLIWLETVQSLKCKNVRGAAVEGALAQETIL